MNELQKKPGLISCIVPVYNRSDLIIECVESVINQTYKNFEIIIVDDGSTDNTLQVLEELSKKYPDVINVVTQTNQGPGAARQTGLNRSRGQYVQFLDSDDLIKPEKFKLFINEFSGADSADIVYCITHHYLIGQADKFIIWKNEQHQSTSILPDFLVSRAWSTSTPIYRKSLLDNAGEILPLSCEEDLEYDCRIGLQLPKIKFVNQHLTDFRGHSGQRFSVNHPDRANQLSDQIMARQNIYQTIKIFNLAAESKELAFYSKTLFLLARQAAEMGLPEQAKSALYVARATARQKNANTAITMNIYQIICTLLGTKNGAWLFNCIYDRLHHFKNKKTAG